MIFEGRGSGAGNKLKPKGKASKIPLWPAVSQLPTVVVKDHFAVYFVEEKTSDQIGKEGAGKRRAPGA